MARKKPAKYLKKKPKHAKTSQKIKVTSKKRLTKPKKSAKVTQLSRPKWVKASPFKVLGKRAIKRPDKIVPINSQAFKDLQKTWYAKLKETGFNDLETSGPNGEGPLSTRGAQPSANFVDAALQSRELYYRRLTNYVTHNPNWSGSKFNNLIAALYVDGVSYRKMLPIIKAKLKRVTSIWSIHKVIKQLEVKAKKWNETHPEGIDFTADFDSIVTA